MSIHYCVSILPDSMHFDYSINALGYFHSNHLYVIDNKNVISMIIMIVIMIMKCMFVHVVLYPYARIFTLLIVIGSILYIYFLISRVHCPTYPYINTSIFC